MTDIIRPRKRLYSHVTKTRFLHLEDALDIGKIRLFAGAYRKGSGASATAHHFVDLDDARVLLADLSWGKSVEFTDYKGTSNGDGPQSRVLKIKASGDKVWLEIQNGPGEVVGQGAIKPKGKPTAAVSIPLTVWESRKLAHAALAYVHAWESKHLLAAASLAPSLSEGEGWGEGGRGEGSPVATKPADQVAAGVTTAPEVFNSPGEAIAWGFKTGAFQAHQHAENAYNKLKDEKQPMSAHEMAALWIEDVQRRLADAAADQVLAVETVSQQTGLACPEQS